MAENRFKYRITATDETAKGVKSAEKQMGGLTKATKAYGVASQKAQKHGPGSKSGLAQVKGAMDQAKSATGRLVSVAPGVSRYTSTLGEVHEAAVKAASGMREAAQSGSGLGAAIGGVAAAAGGAVGIVAALTAGAVKLASGWAEGGAQLARLSAGIGVTTEDLQKFQAAGERFGVSKEDTTGALGSLASNMHEAKYGRNNTVLALMNQLGLSMRQKPDGSMDASAELLDLADKIPQYKDPQTQARIADLLGVSSALPMLRQGRAAVQAAMDDAAKHAAVMPGSDVADASRIWQKGVLGKQLAGRAGMLIDRQAALAAEPGLDAANAAGRDIADGKAGTGIGRTVAGAASAGVAALAGTTRWATGEVAHFGGALGALASRIEHLGERSRQDQVSPKGARGVMQVMPGTAEDVARKHGIAWSGKRYRDDAGYSRQLGGAYLSDMLGHYEGDEALATAAYNAGPGRVDRDKRHYMADHGGRFDEQAFLADPHYLPKETRDYVQRVQRSADETPVHVTLEITGLPAGAKVAAKSKTGAGVSVGPASVGSDGL
jgi:hypothetical protein